MYVLSKSKEFFYLIIPFNIITKDEVATITKVKNIFLTYNNKYNILTPGLYESILYHHNLIGTIISVEKLDEFNFTEEIDLKVIIKDSIKAYLELEDALDFPNYQGKIDLDTITYQEFLTLLEHGKITIKKFSN